MERRVCNTRLKPTGCGRRSQQTGLISSHHGTVKKCRAMAALSAPLGRLQQEQALSLDRVIDGLDVDSLASLGFHGPDDIRGLVASEAVRSAALITVPISSTLAVSVDDGGQLSVLTPPEMPANVRKAVEVVAGLVRETPDHQLLILAVLLLWVRKYGSTAWREYCEALLPPAREMSCLLCYTPGELSALQLPHLVVEASRQHDWARWVHTQWTSSSSGALRRLALADSLEETMWALAVVRSRAVEFPVGVTAGSGSGSASASGSGQGRMRRPVGPTVSVLAPVVDLANHCNNPNCVVQLTTDRSRVVLLPRRPIAAGEPLTVDYGYDRSSLELMADYGFVTPANPYDGDIELPGADRLVSLERPRLEAAARALMRRRRRQRQMVAAHLAAATSDPTPAESVSGGASAGAEEVEGDAGTQVGRDAGDGALSEAVLLSEDDATGSASEDQDDVCYSGRLRAAVNLLSPRASPGAGNFSTPATQRIVAGLWHKLVQHCAEKLPTTLQQDRDLLDDIQGGRVSGFAAGFPLSVDPAAVRIAPVAAPAWGVSAAAATEQPSRPLKRGRRKKAADPEPITRENSWGTVVLEASAGPVETSAPATAAATGRDGAQDGGGGVSAVATAGGMAAPAAGSDQNLAATPGTASTAARASAASPPSSSSSSSGLLCHTARRAGRLYAAVLARLEHKELLQVAEELLLQYGRS